MKLIDKLKNVFFEEVEDEDEEELPQTFAKKVEVPKKAYPKEEIKEKVNTKEDFKHFLEDEPEEKTMEIHVEPEKEEEKIVPMMDDVDDFMQDKTEELPIVGRKIETNVSAMPKRERSSYDEPVYHGKQEVSYTETVDKGAYSYTKSYHEEKETKGFRPSPIISPIYGILDKNYRKEEVVTKKETRITSTYKKPDLDSVRNKAFGQEEEIKREKPKTNFDENEEDKKRVYDVNSNKPQVNRVTLADADEYYNDLGLAYNVDYSDASRVNKETRTSKYSGKENKKEKTSVDDNLFDLIDSMYNKED